MTVRALSLALSFALGVAAAPTPVAAQSKPPASTKAEIDALWAAASAAVAKDDIVALGRIYHPAAILVDDSGTQPIAAALQGWGKDMVAAKQAGTKASVTFRFSKRQDNAETAFASGIFLYTTTTKAGVANPGYRRFEALLIKSGGKWQMLMERQLEPVTEKEWNALPR
ncbi:MAG: nuclear transport factor 2 family protein [Gemmatimonadetes bacterium]|nr:nuclear transport factor 2 family protein [Gemmatimonadota bacterium]